MSDPEFRGGWAMVGSARRFHFYDAERRSLCRKWVALFTPDGAFEFDTTVKSDECAGCRKALDRQTEKASAA